MTSRQSGKILLILIILIIAAAGAAGTYYFFAENSTASDTALAEEILQQGHTYKTALIRDYDKNKVPVRSLDQLHQNETLLTRLRPDPSAFVGQPGDWELTTLYFPQAGGYRNVIILNNLRKSVVTRLQTLTRTQAYKDRLKIQDHHADASSPTRVIDLKDLVVRYQPSPESAATEYSYKDYVSRHSGRAPADLREFGTGAALYFYNNRALTFEDESEYVTRETIPGLNRPFQEDERNPSLTFLLAGEAIHNPFPVIRRESYTFIPDSHTGREAVSPLSTVTLPHIDNDMIEDFPAFPVVYKGPAKIGAYVILLERE